MALRMKAGREFAVPLSTGALGVLGRRRTLSRESSTVFPPRTGGPLPRSALGPRAAPRRSRVDGSRLPVECRSWMAEPGVPTEVAEACVAHVPRSRVVQAYQAPTCWSAAPRGSPGVKRVRSRNDRRRWSHRTEQLCWTRTAVTKSITPADREYTNGLGRRATRCGSMWMGTISIVSTAMNPPKT